MNYLPHHLLIAMPSMGDPRFSQTVIYLCAHSDNGAMGLIVNKATGVKFGKSEGGAIWLDATKTSPYRFYQFWLTVDDETAKDLIKVYTLLSRETVTDLIAKHEEEPAKRVLQATPRGPR